MTQNEVNKSILEIQTELGINGRVIAKAMGITYNTFKKKNSDNEQTHSFNEKNLNDLKKYLKKYIEKL